MDEFEEETERLIAELDLEKERESEGEEVGTDTNDNSEEQTDTSDGDEGTDDNAGEQEKPEEDSEEKVDEGEGEEKKEEEKSEDDFEPITVKAGEFDIVIENKEDLMAYLTKGAEAVTKPTNEKTLESKIVEQGELTQEELTLLVDAKNGSKEAIAKLLEISKVDQFEIEDGMSENYKPEFKPYIETDIDKVANEIMQDKDLTSQYQNITQQIDKDFVDKVQSNAELLKNFAGHIKSGLAMEIIPQAMTHRMKNGGSFFDAYSAVGQQLVQNRGKETQVEDKKMEEKVVSEREKSLREKITDQKETSHNEGKPETAKEIWELTEDEFTEQFGE